MDNILNDWLLLCEAAGVPVNASALRNSPDWRELAEAYPDFMRDLGNYLGTGTVGDQGKIKRAVELINDLFRANQDKKTDRFLPAITRPHWALMQKIATTIRVGLDTLDKKADSAWDKAGVANRDRSAVKEAIAMLEAVIEGIDAL